MLLAMRSRQRVMWLLSPALLALAAFAFASSVAACSSSDSTGNGSSGGIEAGGAESGLDATPGIDAPRDGNMRDANGPGALDGICSFNWDCQSALRCACDEASGCACKPGARGTGRNGIDPCVSGNACASAVCVEGPADGGSFCSDECGTSADCTGKLPVCKTISFVGRICIRAP